MEQFSESTRLCWEYIVVKCRKIWGTEKHKVF